MSHRLARLPGPLVLLLVALAYGLTAQAALLLVDPEYGLGAFWPSAGLALAALLHLPVRRWAWALSCVAVATVAGDLAQGYPSAPLPWWVLGNVLTPLAGAGLIRRVGHVDGPLARARDVAWFVLFGVVVGPLLGATVGSVVFAAAVGVPWLQLWPQYVIGDALGILVVAPALLARAGPSWRARRLERAVLTGALLVAPFVLFVGWTGLWTVPVPYLVMPLLSWAAVRFGLRGGSLALLWTAIVANGVMALGQGPFVLLGAPEGATVALVQLYMVVTATSTLTLAALASELSDRQDVERGLRDQARRDGLTGLPNRTLLAEELPRALARCQSGERRLAVLVCDLDDFKGINDTLGHQAGDEALVAIARRLSAAVREGDTVARLGGDEFVLLIEGVEAVDDLESMVARLVERIAEPVQLQSGHVVRSRASVGLVLAAADDDVDSVLAHADVAMYRAKQSGGGQVYRCPHDHRGRHGAEQRALQDDLLPALARGDVVCSNEPLHDLVTGEVVLDTARVHWDHAEQGRLEAEEFVAIAEATGIVGTLFHSVLEQSLAARAGAGEPDLPAVAVPVPARLVTDPELVDVVAAELAAHGVAADELCLDIPVGAVPEDPHGWALSDLTGLGVRLAAVGVGGDWSSLPRLARVDWDLLKVDAALVARLGDRDAAPWRLLASLVAVADAWGAPLAAEGVETTEQLEALEALGCRLAQGPRLGRAPRLA